jgi:small subunit ribosomal protein S14
VAKTSQIVRQQRGSKYKTREYSRCRRCGRPRRRHPPAHNGYIPGMTKSSW